MSDTAYVGLRVGNVDVSPQFNAYSKVIIHIDDETEVVAGNDTGRTLEIDNPFGNQQMADDMLSRLRGYQYQPYQADDALLDPAAEIGDAVETSTSYGGLYTRSRTFDRLMAADVSAPHDEEINHEFKYASPQERRFKRQVGEVRASIILTNNMIRQEVADRQNADDAMSTRITETANAVQIEAERASQAEGDLSAALSVQATQIAAKVSASGGSNTSGSFSWVMKTSGHRWYANGNSTPIMEVTASGLTVRGKGIFNEGQIGGFSIGATALSYNGLSWGDTSKNYGVYLGQSGIQLGKNFKVDNGGNVAATNMTLSGTLTIGGKQITAANLYTGAAQAANNYGSWNSAYDSTSPGGYCYGGSGYGYGYGNATTRNTNTYPDYFTAGAITAKESIVALKNFQVAGIAIIASMMYAGYTMQLKSVQLANGGTAFALCAA